MPAETRPKIKPARAATGVALHEFMDVAGHETPADRPVALAAILYNPSDGRAVDAILTGLTEELRAETYKLAGAVQWNTLSASGPCSDMVLEGLASGRRVNVSENRGSLFKGCRLDSSALEEVAGLVSSSIGGDVDLVIINKFSKSEAQGSGLRQAIEAAVMAGSPVLVGLNATHRAAWEVFSGGVTEWLPAEAAAIRRWCHEILSASAPAA